MKHLSHCSKLVLVFGIVTVFNVTALAQVSLPPAGQVARRVSTKQVVVSADGTTSGTKSTQVKKAVQNLQSSASKTTQSQNGIQTEAVTASSSASPAQGAANQSNPYSISDCPDPTPPTNQTSTSLPDSVQKQHDLDQDSYCRDHASNGASWEAWQGIANLDELGGDLKVTSTTMHLLREFAFRLGNLPDANQAPVFASNSQQEMLSKDNSSSDSDATKAINNAAIKTITVAVQNIKCAWWVNPSSKPTTDSSGNPAAAYTYTYAYTGRNAGLLPLIGKGCGDNEIQNFFGLDTWQHLVSQVGYKYNVKGSESQVSSDLFTLVFRPGIQVVFGTTVTSSNSRASSSTSSGSSGSSGASTPALHGAFLPHRFDTTSSTSTTGTTDQVSTAISKLETGGDFNISARFPFFYRQGGLGVVAGKFDPNVGFTVNGLSSQSTITNATYNTYSLPLEFYYESAAVADPNNASNNGTFLVDVKPQAEFLGSAVAQQLGPSVGTKLFLLQAAAGFNFQKAVQFSAQYNYGNTSVFQSASSSSSGSGSSTTPTTSIKGLQFAISYTPQSKSSK
jgi:hypothetical protein